MGYRCPPVASLIHLNINSIMCSFITKPASYCTVTLKLGKYQLGMITFKLGKRAGANTPNLWGGSDPHACWEGRDRTPSSFRDLGKKHRMNHPKEPWPTMVKELKEGRQGGRGNLTQSNKSKLVWTWFYYMIEGSANGSCFFIAKIRRKIQPERTHVERSTSKENERLFVEKIFSAAAHFTNSREEFAS